MSELLVARHSVGGASVAQHCVVLDVAIAGLRWGEIAASRVRVQERDLHKE